jgi:hypothetical protein
MAAATATPLELSKIAQEQILASIKQSQDIALAGVEAWASAFAPFAKAAQVPVPVPFPSASDFVASSFGFTEKILASQKAFAEKLVAASAPVVDATTTPSK